MKTTQYIIALLAITALASCGTTQDINPEIIKESPQDPIAQEILEEVAPIIETLIENTDENMEESLSNASPEDFTESNSEDTTEKIIQNTDSKVQILNQTYTTPAGDHDISFALETSEGIIQSVSVDSRKVDHPVTLKMIGLFNGASSELVGLSIQDAKDIGVIGGASLTTGAFKAAIAGL